MATAVPGPSPDVVVIGGGIIGASAAAHLAEAGRRVLLVERSDIGAGASGRNSGVVQHPFDPVLVELHLETVGLYRRLETATDGLLRLPERPSGLLMVTTDVDGARRAAAALGASHPSLEPAFLDPDAIRAIEPALAPGIAACRLEIGFPVGPLSATRAYATWAERLGVAVRTGCAATPVVDGRRALSVRLDDGTTVPAADVVVAAGPWSPGLVDPTGRWRPIVPRWGVVVAVELAAPPRHVLEEAEIEIEPGADDDRDDVSFSLVTAEGASSVGSTFLADEPDDGAYVDAILERGARFVPEIASARRTGHRRCARPRSRDGRPLVGRIPGTEGLWIAAGHGPWGISTGPASGRMVAGLVTGATGEPPPALDPGRFAD